MSSCAVATCHNNFRQGYRMFSFPRNTKRRDVWIHHCQREKGWMPTSASKLCEVHFDESQFEPHREGKKKLKQNAIPTKFDVSIAPKLLKRTKKDGSGNEVHCKIQKLSKREIRPKNSTSEIEVVTEITNISYQDNIEILDTTES